MLRFSQSESNKLLPNPRTATNPYPTWLWTSTNGTCHKSRPPFVPFHQILTERSCFLRHCIVLWSLDLNWSHSSSLFLIYFPLFLRNVRMMSATTSTYKKNNGKFSHPKTMRNVSISNSLYFFWKTLILVILFISFFVLKISIAPFLLKLHRFLPLLLFLFIV